MCVRKHARVMRGGSGRKWCSPLVHISTNVQPKLPWQLQTKPKAFSITLRADRASLRFLSAFIGVLRFSTTPNPTFNQISGHLLQSRFLCIHAVWLILGQQWFVHFHLMNTLKQREMKWSRHNNIVETQLKLSKMKFSGWLGKLCNRWIGCDTFVLCLFRLIILHLNTAQIFTDYRKYLKTALCLCKNGNMKAKHKT